MQNKKMMTEVEAIRKEERRKQNEQVIARKDDKGNYKQHYETAEEKRIAKSFLSIRTRSAQKKNKMFFASVDVFSDDVQMVLDIIESDISGLGKADLIGLCKLVSVPFSGKKKAVLIDNLKNWREDVLKRTNTTSKEDNTNFADPATLEYVAEHNLHVVIARSVVETIANMGRAAGFEIEKDDDNATIRQKWMATIEGYKDIKFSGVQACLDISNSHYQQPIFEDITQDMFETVYHLWERGLIRIENGFVSPVEYMTGYTVEYSKTSGKDDKRIIRKGVSPETVQNMMDDNRYKDVEVVGISRRSVWSDFKMSVQRSLERMKEADWQRAKAGAWFINDEGFVIGEKSSQYISALMSGTRLAECRMVGCDETTTTHTIEDVLQDSSLLEFMGAFGRKYPKYENRFNNIVFGIFGGYCGSMTDVADFVGLSLDQVRYTILLAKAFYHSKAWDAQDLTKHYNSSSDSNRIGCRPIVSDSSKRGTMGWSCLTSLNGASELEKPANPASPAYWDKLEDVHGNVYRKKPITKKLYPTIPVIDGMRDF